MSLGEKQLQCLSPWFVAASLEVLSGDGRGTGCGASGVFLKELCWELFSSDSCAAMVTYSCSLTERAASVAAQGPHCPPDMEPSEPLGCCCVCCCCCRRSCFILCSLLFSGVTGVIIDAAKASRAAFYCWSQAAELIISGRIDQSESRKVLSAVTVEFSAKQEVAFIWFTHCEMLSFNNSLCFNPSSFLL